MSNSNQPSYYVANPDFDVQVQPFQLKYPDGVHQFTATIDSITGLQRLAVQTGMVFGVQMGVSIVLILILALLTKPEKRRSAIFILNQAALVCLFIRAVLMCATVLGPFYNYYNFEASYFPHVHKAQRISVVCEVFSFLTTAAVELSMMFQVRVVCCTLRAVWRNVVTAACLLVALFVCSVRFGLMVLNADYGIVHVDTSTQQQLSNISSLASLNNICTVASIFFFSVIFCTKLGHAIHHRRKMGMKQFGPMQIIFVMGCQTMFIPGKFLLLLPLMFQP